MLIFGGELNDFARRLMYVVLVAGILLGATQIVTPVRIDWRLHRHAGRTCTGDGSYVVSWWEGGGPMADTSPTLARSRIHRALSRPEPDDGRRPGIGAADRPCLRDPVLRRAHPVRDNAASCSQPPSSDWNRSRMTMPPSGCPSGPNARASRGQPDLLVGKPRVRTSDANGPIRRDPGVDDAGDHSSDQSSGAQRSTIWALECWCRSPILDDRDLPCRLARSGKTSTSTISPARISTGRTDRKRWCRSRLVSCGC